MLQTRKTKEFGRYTNQVEITKKADEFDFICFLFFKNFQQNFYFIQPNFLYNLSQTPNNCVQGPTSKNTLMAQRNVRKMRSNQTASSQVGQIAPTIAFSTTFVPRKIAVPPTRRKTILHQTFVFWKLLNLPSYKMPITKPKIKPQFSKQCSVSAKKKPQSPIAKMPK